MSREIHGIAPVFDENSRVLILGSFPSKKSREEGFFYAHPQNRFWKVLCAVLSEDIPHTVEQKRSMLLKNGIALWDVCAECDIQASSDAAIKNVRVNDLSPILSIAKIEHIFTNGATADKLYKKLMLENVGIEAYRLPSTSPANAAFSLKRLTVEWGAVKTALSDTK